MKIRELTQRLAKSTQATALRQNQLLRGLHLSSTSTNVIKPSAACRPMHTRVAGMFRPLTTIRSRQLSTHILHITDSEGTNALIDSINKSNIVSYHPDNGLDFKKVNGTPHFIFGGDAPDRGNKDLSLTQMLVDFKKRYPDKVNLIVGNREVTKNRYLELAPELIRERILHSAPPFWLLPQQHTAPLDYAKISMIAEGKHDNIEKYINSLSISQCQLIYLKWMLEKTMGCPHTFRYRREELTQLLKRNILDEEVLQSFIRATSPNGIMGEYLQLAEVGVIVPNTNVLAVHGGITEANVGRVPESNDIIPDAKKWISTSNNWYQEQIKKWINYKPIKLTPPAHTELDKASLPAKDKGSWIITANMLDKNRQFIDISPIVNDYLSDNGISIVLTGHQPSGDHPAILRSVTNRVVFINGDTGYAKINPTNPDDTRGVACHTTEIQADLQHADIQIKAVLSDSTAVQTRLTVTDSKIEGDNHIGKVLLDQRLVQCRLENGDYRLIHQKGFQVTYSILSEKELEKQLSIKIQQSLSNVDSHHSLSKIRNNA
jgi:hypothetical protein